MIDGATTARRRCAHGRARDQEAPDPPVVVDGRRTES